MYTQSGDVGLSEVCRESGLTRHQIDYLERRGFLGEVHRAERAGKLNGARNRQFSTEQRQVLVRYGELRASGISVDAAGAVAAEGTPGIRPVTTDRLQSLARRNSEQLATRLRAAVILNDLLLARLVEAPGAQAQWPSGPARGPGGSVVAPSRAGPSRSGPGP